MVMRIITQSLPLKSPAKHRLQKVMVTASQLSRVQAPDVSGMILIMMVLRASLTRMVSIILPSGGRAYFLLCWMSQRSKALCRIGRMLPTLHLQRVKILQMRGTLSWLFTRILIHLMACPKNQDLKWSFFRRQGGRTLHQYPNKKSCAKWGMQWGFNVPTMHLAR